MIDHEKRLSNRRAFFTTLGTTSIAGAALLASGTKAMAQGSSPDVDIVQFALNLEYLEAEFYSVATSGMTIEQKGVGVNGSGTPGPTTGGQKVRFINGSTFPGQVAAEIAVDEREHVMFLRNLLNSMGIVPIAKPAINLDALGIGFANQADFFTLARAFEDVGVTAYAGAAPLLTIPEILGYAAQILAVESLHSGNIRLQVANMNIPTTALDGVDILPPPSGTHFFPTDSNALVEIRTPQQVLYIVYGAANVTSGGFFPSGVNGVINMSGPPA